MESKMKNRAESWKLTPPAPEYLASLSWAQFRQELGRQLALARETYEGNCIVCGKHFIGPKKRRYCSNTCLVRHRRDQQREDKKVPG